MKLIFWLLIGLGAGTIAKFLTPQNEKGGWISSMVFGIAGAVVGYFIADIIGMERILGGTWLGALLMATGGAVLVLFVYHRYLKEKLKLPF